MADTNRNAGIWYVDDGYDPDNKGLNGRRVAGASFLKGFFAHADVDEITSVTLGDGGNESFQARLKASGRDVPHRNVFQRALATLTPINTLYYPSPNYAEMAWLRQHVGMQRFSICGITHTTATKAAMEGFFDLRAAPQAEWDAVICTSRAVHAATVKSFDLADQYLTQRFGSVPPRPQLPVIPLGITCDDFLPDPAAGTALRERMNWGPNDIVFATLSRLIPYGKFDPGPLFLALQEAQDRLSDGVRLHFIACGIYGDEHSEKIYKSCSKAFMPDVSFTHLDGADATARQETLSAADVFTFPIDNIQETFGLAPIEAMAAGLPVLTSDWDGMRDTVTDDVGIRVPTLSASGRHTRLEAARYHAGAMSYAQYGNNIAAMTALDMSAFVNAIVTLASDADLRKRMGAAGQQRARALYDWAAVIPQMQDLWAELNAIRERAAAPPPTPVPMAPPPMSLFSSYPTHLLGFERGRFFANKTPKTVAEVFEARRYTQLKNMIDSAEVIDRIYQTLVRTQASGASSKELSDQLNLPTSRIERGCVFLLKYGFARYEDS